MSLHQFHIDSEARRKYWELRKLDPNSILNVGQSWEKYRKYARITFSEHINGEGKMKAENIDGEETGLRCWIKDEGYANIEIEYITNKEGEQVKKYSKDKTKILISYKHRLPGYVNQQGKIQIDFEKRYRYVEPKYIKGGKFSGQRHEWQKGEHIEQQGLTTHAKKTIKLSSRIMRDLSNAKYEKTNFITLTYGRDVPDDLTAKRHLKQFFQRLQRHFGTKFNYVWVAEMQMGTEGSYRQINGAAIHFHILIDRCIKLTEKQKTQMKNVYVPPDLIESRCKLDTGKLDQLVWINYHWNDIVNKWQSKNNLPIQTITRTDCETVQDAGNYLAKYLSKEEHKIIGRMWGIADVTRELINDVKETHYDLPIKYAEKIMQEATAMFYDQFMCLYEQDKDGNYVEVKSNNFIAITDRTSAFFEDPIYTPDEQIEREQQSLEKEFSKCNVKDYKDYYQFKEKYDGQKLYQHIPDYPSAWSNNIVALQSIFEDLIEYYDNEKTARKNIKSLVYMYDD